MQCEGHPHMEVTHYCAVCDQLMCAECVKFKHALHKDRHVRVMGNHEIEKIMNETGERLEAIGDKVTFLLGEIHSYKDRKIELPAKNVIAILNQANQLSPITFIKKQDPMSIINEDPILSHSVLASNYKLLI